MIEGLVMGEDKKIDKNTSNKRGPIEPENQTLKDSFSQKENDSQGTSEAERQSKNSGEVKTEKPSKELSQENSKDPEKESLSEVLQKPSDKKEHSHAVKLKGLYAFKEGMSSVYDKEGKKVPVTVLKYEPMILSQLKTVNKENHRTVQTAFVPKSPLKTKKSEKGHFKKAGFQRGFRYVKEIACEESLSKTVTLGQLVDINSLSQGDRVKLTSRSKGRGFSGVVKRHNFGGGPASHGSKSYRRVGSIGNIRAQGRVFKGKKMPGRYGYENHTRKNVLVVDVLADQKIILVKGPVAGARCSLVCLTKM